MRGCRAASPTETWLDGWQDHLLGRHHRPRSGVISAALSFALETAAAITGWLLAERRQDIAHFTFSPRASGGPIPPVGQDQGWPKARDDAGP